MTSQGEVPSSVVSLPADFILQHEISQVETSFKSAAMNVADIYKARARTAGISSRHANRYPSATLTRSLALQIEKYDSFCDTIELELAKAIAVTRREVAKEEARQLRVSRSAMQVDETQVLPAKEPDAKEASEISPSLTEQFALPPLPFGLQMGMGLAGPLNAQARRQSTVSLSSLRGPRPGAPFPLKLDLSATALRLDDTMIPGLFSPVTLAPRTARPLQSAVDSDAIHSFANADVGLSENDAVPGLDSIAIDIHDGDAAALSQAGNTVGSDQLPLTLDLADAGDMESLFGDVSSAVETRAPELPSLTNVETAITSGSIGDDGLFTPIETQNSQMLETLGDASSILTAPGALDQAAMMLSSAGLEPQRTESPLGTSSISADHANLGADFDLNMDFSEFDDSIFQDFGGEPMQSLEGPDGNMDIVQQLALLDSSLPPSSNG